MSSLKYSLGYNPGNVTGRDGEILITPEMRALMTPFSDPFFRNFKILLNTSIKKGLLAPEYNEDGSYNVDSAEAFLRRIGEDERADMLQGWVELTKSIFRDYEFLIMNIDGLDATFSYVPHQSFKGNENVTVEFRETIDGKIFTWYTLYRDIYYDAIRNVEVIPSNLRRIPMSVIIYPSGYFNSDFYDLWEDTKYAQVWSDFGYTKTDDEIRYVLPTHKKMSRINCAQDLKTANTFNYSLVDFPAALINCELSGDGYANNVTNEPSADMTKISITFNFYSANVKHVATNMIGPYSFRDMLALISAQSKFETTSKAISGSSVSLDDQNFMSNWLKGVKERLGVKTPNKWATEFIQSWGNAAQNMIGSTRLVEQWMLQNATDNLLGTFENSKVGNAILTYTNPGFAADWVNQKYIEMLDKGVGNLGKTDFGKFLTTNFSNAHYLVEGLNQTYDAVSLMNPAERHSQPQFPENPEYEENITSEFITSKNIYTRKGF